MGKWNNRSRFNRRRSPSRWYSERPSSSSGYGEDDGIPAWEKRFCEVIGSVPWPKVVEATNFKSWYTGNVITWDDSACQETFHNEKKRFWSRVNGFHCDISLPDPDLYVSEVDWDNATVDPELISDLERAYFAPPDDDVVKSGLKRGRRDRSWSGCSNLVPIEETRMLKGSEEVHGWNVAESSRDHPNDRTWQWEAKTSFGNERANDTMDGDCLTTEGWKEVELETKDTDRWDQGDNGWEQNKKAKGAESVLAKEDEMFDNPWEAKVSCRKEAAEDTTWGGWSGKGWDDDRGWGSDGWGKRDSGNQVMEIKEWRSTRCSQDYREPRSYNPWKAGFVPDNTTRREYGANAGGWQTQTNRRDWDVKRSSDCWGRRDRGRDESCGYNTNYRNSRPIRDDYQNRKVNFSSK